MATSTERAGGVSAPTATTGERALRWALVAAWVTVPITLGDLVGDALADAGRTAQLIDGIACWVAWTVGLVALLLPTTVSLTVARIIVPGAVLVAVIAGVHATAQPAFEVRPIHAIGTAIAGIATVLVLSPQVGSILVNGSAYGDERRFLLRAPAALLFGPLELAWLVAAGGVLAGPLLLGAEHWVGGTVALVIGLPAALLAARALHGLHRRWFVLVPTGVVLHDWSALTESVMAPRRQIAELGPAPADADALDLTLGAAGLALRLVLHDDVSIARRPGRRPGSGAVVELVEARAVLFTPTRPGRLLTEAQARRLPIG